MILDSIRLAGLAAVMLAWVVFGVLFVFRKRPPQSPQANRASGAVWGIVLQTLSYGMLWISPRYEVAIFPVPPVVETVLAMFAAGTAFASVVLCIKAIRTLGRQFAVVASVIEGHRLVVSGPYRFVRNPVYFGLFALLVATGIVVAKWYLLCLAIAVFMVGNSIRIHYEEQLLRQLFGQQFDDYARRVPAMFPLRIGKSKTT